MYGDKQCLAFRPQPQAIYDLPALIKALKGRQNAEVPTGYLLRQLGVVQFFSWFALFSMWVFTTPAVAQHIYHVAPGDTSSAQGSPLPPC